METGKIYSSLREKARQLKKKYMHKAVISELWKTGKEPLIYAILGGIALLIIIPILTYLFFIRDLTSKENILTRKNAGILLVDRNDKPFFTFYEAKNKRIIPFEQIPEQTKEAVIAIEDREFYKHPGFSLRGITRAFFANIEEEAISQGGSTISQQLVKNTLLQQDRSIIRKYQEIFLALEVERRFTKQEILEMYLNTVYFGEGAFGIEDASFAYFGKSAADLTLAESALLAGILPAPSALSPFSGNTERAFQRQKIVLQKMRELGYITKDMEEEAAVQEITFNPVKSDLNNRAPHFALMVKQELIDTYGEQRVARSGYKVRTTIDLSWQEYAEQVVQNQVQRLSYNKVTNAATVVLNPKTGEILALVGSHDWYDEKNGKFNMVLAPRQPGSSFKPIVYARGIEDQDITAGTVLEDKAIAFSDGYKPKNYDGKFRGKVLVRFALANSLNIPAILVLDKVGINDAISMGERLGITTLKNPSDYGLSLVLGAAEVPLLQMTGAFGVFANSGERVTPTTILEIRDKHDSLVYTHRPDPKKVLDAGVAYIISSILSDNNVRSEVFGNALTISRPAAVKTGTTEDYRDALTIGFTPSLAIGVWVGNNDRAPMDSIAGSLGAAPIWRLLMERFLQNTPVERFTPPADVIRLSICKENGLRAETATSSAYPEFFLRGTLPKASCNKAGEFPNSPSPEKEEKKPTVTDTPLEEEPTETPEPTGEPQETPADTPSPTDTIQILP